MKRFLLFIILNLYVSLVSSQSRYWVGASGGLWSSTTNWSTTSLGTPGASSPTTANDVIFDNGFNGVVEMDVLPASSPFTYTINSLLVTASSSVTLERTQSGGGDRILQLASTSSVTKGLKIDNGSSLSIAAVNTGGGNLDYTLALTGGAGVTGEISGDLHIKGTGPCGTEIDLQDDPTHYATLAVKNLGIIKYFDNTDNTSPATGSYLTMESGSTYEIEKNGGSFPPGTWDPNSLVKVSGTGPNPPTFNGTVYGNLEWNCINQGNYGLNLDITFNSVNFISTNNAAFRIKSGASLTDHTMTINGNLDISGESFIEIVGNSALSPHFGKIILKGDLNIQSGGVLTTNGVAGTSNQFELQGSFNQNITNDGLLGGIRFEFIMNGVGATLLTPITLPGNNSATGANLQLVNGKITTTSINLLTMINDAAVSGGSTASFVSGPMQKRGDDNFIFPVGVGSIYAPIGITNVLDQATSDEFTAEYKRANPQSTTPYGPNVVSGMNHVSYVEYWTLTQSTGNATKKVSLDVHLFSFCKLLANTYVSKWSSASSYWTNEGSTFVYGPGSPPYETGTITSTTVSISNFVAPDNAFTLITDELISGNPLPIDLISFNASKLVNTKSTLNWELSACCSAAAKFEIQRADANKNFISIGIVGGSETNKSYNYIDNGLKNGINYYRLKMTDADGKITYSRTVAVMNGVSGLLLTSLIPTMVTNTTMLTIASSKQQKLDLVITDMQGRIMLKQNYTVAAGNTNIQIPSDRLSAGVYQLVGITSEDKTNMIRFIKQ